MSAPKPAERSKASKLRRRVREGEQLSRRDAEWLAKYEKARGREPSLSVQTTAPRAPAEPVKTPTPAPTDGDYVEIVEGEPIDDPPESSAASTSSATPTTPAKGCPAGPDCPACSGRDQAGPVICATTGREVWPPMSKGAALGMARAIFLVIGIAIRVLRGADSLCEPTEPEENELAEALIEIARRRVGWISAWSDLAQAGFALTSYGRRAMSAPKRAAEIPADAAR